VIQGGELKSKGVNLPNTKYHFQRWQKKDIADAIFAIEQKVDCTFFCKTPQDLKDLQNLIAEHSDYKIPIIAKIEMKH
jgi:pyruvate kinase